MTSVPYFVARPGTPAPWPGVVVLMEGMGITPQLLRVCERLSGEGYAAVAPDLFHRFGGSDPDKMPEQFSALRSEDAMEDIGECAAELRRLGASSVGVTGFCMGGRLSYEAALAGVDLQAVAPFYGAGTGRLLGRPTCPILCFFGGRDEYIPPEEVEAVEAHHPGHVVVYPDAPHGFMRDGSDSYREDAAVDAWGRLLDFLGSSLG